MDNKPNISGKVPEERLSPLLNFIYKYRTLFLLLLSIGITCLIVALKHKPALEGICHNYPVLIAMVIMNYSVLKVVAGFRDSKDYLIAIIGTALFVYFGFFHSSTRLVLREEYSGEFYLFNYAMIRICWAIFLISKRFAKRLYTILFFVISLGVILLLYYVLKLNQHYPDDYLSLLVLPLIIYPLSMLALLSEKLMSDMWSRTVEGREEKE